MKGILRITLIISLVLTLLLAGLPAAAEEAPPTFWEKTFGGDGRDWGNDVIQTSDGGYLTVGSNWSIAGYSDLWVIKTDSDGEVEWDKNFGGEDPYFGVSGLQTEDGGYAIFGYYMPGDWDFHQLFMIQLDSNGNKQWEKLINETVDSRGEAVIQTTDGGYVIAGTCGAYAMEGGDALLIKTDSAGNTQWYKTWGEMNNDYGHSLVQTTDGSYLILGHNNSYDTKGAWLIKTDENGNLEWEKIFESGSGNSIIKADNGYVIAGTKDSDIWLLKTDSDGNMLWEQTYGSTDEERGYSVKPTVEGGYIITGSTNSYGSGQSDVWLIKSDASGNKQWSKTFGDTDYDYGRSVIQDANGNYVIAGSKSSSSTGNDDVYLIKVAGEGTVIPGDANGDGAVNALDITQVERIIVELDPETPGADANQDGSVNALDITQIERIIVKLP